MARRRRSGVVRLGVSLEPELLRLLDGWVHRRNSASRSEAIRALIRKELTQELLVDPDARAVGSILLLYRHDAPNVLRQLTAVAHGWEGHIHFSGHVHLAGPACMELIAVEGTGREVRQIAEDLRGIKRVAFGAFSIGAPDLLQTKGSGAPRAGHRRTPPHRHSS